METTDVLAECATGKLRGRREEGVSRFGSVPYGKSTDGPRRFAPPEPVEPWTGTLDAIELAPDAARSQWSREGPTPLGTEDCLRLNIWTPSCDDAKRPVLVWIHGGAFINGSASHPVSDGAVLSRLLDVVVVNVGYRLGHLGFLVDPASPSADGRSAGNWGLRDQLAALQWVRTNIEAFGGDPANVTVSGQSAGAISVGVLITTALGRGLFDKAIVMSGAPSLVSQDLTDKLRSDVLAATGVASVEALRELPVEEVVKAPIPAPLGTTSLGPSLDDDLIRTAPAAADYLNVPTIVATTRDEMRFFLKGFLANPMPVPGSATRDQLVGRLDLTCKHARLALDAAALFDHYAAAMEVDLSAPEGSKAAFEVYSALCTDLNYRAPAQTVARALADSGASVFEYSFDYHMASDGGLLRACHTADICFAFDTAAHERFQPFAGSPDDTAPVREEMHAAWHAFMTTGTPASPAAGVWPATDRGTIAHLDAKSSVAPADPAGMELWGDLLLPVPVIGSADVSGKWVA